MKVVDMSSHDFINQSDVELFSPHIHVISIIQDRHSSFKPCWEASSNRSSHKINQSSPQKITPSLSDGDCDPALDECKPRTSCPPSDLVGFSDQHPYSLVKLLRSDSCQTEQLIVMDLKSNEKNSPNNDEFRRMIGLDVHISAKGGGIVDTSFSLRVKLKPGIPINSEKHNEEECWLMEQACM
ncbi:conserved hypothetical protein [Histoplasma capsulatum var. duboisii H88]|uniref:Uncharacterized protein n=1 Tax=Ajellomyces capsulatus (strain H88) TaxID=544711 RepID=F0UM57_AJEC8|nr:conserved hypothetical protein [Histoplasma capsulatum var. duboisii H88]